MSESEQITVAVAADLLGVQRETIYAYVSRGVLDRTYATDPDGRRVSLLDLGQVRDLAAHTHRPRTGQFELTIDTSVSELDPRGGLTYRGRGAVGLAATASYESVAEILWNTGSPGEWVPDEACDDRCRRAVAAAPSEATPADRARIVLSLLAAEPAAEPQVTARAAIVSCARMLAPQPTPWAGDVATTVARSLAQDPPGQATVNLVRRALVLLADHELATSTVAARAAAGTSASTALALLTGAAALGGPLHGLASAAAERTIRRWLLERELDDAAGGFGHRVYTDLDPRAEDLLGATLTAHPELEEPMRSLTLRVLQRDGLHPNIDLALAALTVATPLRPGAGEAIFLVARLAGFAAHAAEEHDQPLRFRPRAIYTGTPSGDAPI